jgi:hypothetical protein
LRWIGLKAVSYVDNFFGVLMNREVGFRMQQPTTEDERWKRKFGIR